MISYYPYLMSSLPALYLGMKPPFRFEEFAAKCESVISSKDMGIIEAVLNEALGARNDTVEERKGNIVLDKWRMFDTDIKNELVKIRAQRKHIDSAKYLRGNRYVPPEITHMLASISRNPSIIDSEKLLDQIRWGFLDELALGRYFDLGALIVYALKLLLLEKWEKINTADKAGLLEQALAGHQL